MVAYFQGVWDELRKVVWPTREELARMTGIVVATVILFGLLIGGADYVLSLGVKQVYTSTGQSQSSPAPSAAPTAPSGQQPPHATPLP
jgi:preprotein translocase subunit SecE